MKRLGPPLLLGAALLAACSPVPRRAAEDPEAARAYAERASRLASVDRWEIDGRLAITDGHDGGSGSLTWIRNGESTVMRFRGAFGRGSWELRADPEEARLVLADGDTHTAAELAELVRTQVGWRVPVEALAWWVRGLAAGSDVTARQLDEAGRLTRLEQSGWIVEFGGYRDDHPAGLPGRVVARRDEYAVKLAIRDWRLDGPDGAR